MYPPIKSPVAFFIFKRPEETAKVFETIRKARPAELFIVADGPRNGEEKHYTDAARKVVENIDWPCKVERNYAENNLGCRQRVWSGIDWVFSKVDRAIILEDDCLPDQVFFTFCDELLERYAFNERVMHIGGTNFQQDNPLFKPQTSYYFSRIAQIWGWATWKRAWRKYDGRLESLPTVKKDEVFSNVFPNRTTRHYFEYLFTRTAEDKNDTWDIAWTYTCFKEKGLCIMPASNLISNIGATASATHTGKSARLSNLPTKSLDLPLSHPQIYTINHESDLYTYRRVFGIRPSSLSNFYFLVKEKAPFLHRLFKKITG